MNTGWVGGAYGVGKRMDLPHTRAMLTAALSGALKDVAFAPHPIFGVRVPASCPGVPAEVLDARAMWSDGAAYDEAARALAGRFQKNFERFSNVSGDIRQAAPAA